ncbi:MAG: DUF4350 domain-containing protein [Planctomycetes bacterium]|nr:DUF4350 domain-containing protein [Planctomycetota bacterium]
MLLVVGGLVATAAWTLHLSFERGRRTLPGSSYRSDAEGSRALFLLLEEKGHRPERLHRPAPPPGALLLSIEPRPMDSEPDQSLLEWLHQGGVLVLAESPATDLASWLSVLTGRQMSKPPLPLGERLGLKLSRGESQGRRTSCWACWPEDAAVLVGPAAAPVLLELSYGAGRVYALAQPAWFENGGIAEGEHLSWVLNLVLSTGRPIYFDEYRHGLEERPGLAYVIERYHLIPAAVSTLLFLALVVWRTSPRESEPAPLRTSPLYGEVRDSLIDVHAAVYARTLRPAEALSLLEHDVRQHLSAALGERRLLSTAEARAQAKERWPGAAARLEAALAELEGLKAKPPLHTADLIPLLRTLLTLLKEVG